MKLIGYILVVLCVAGIFGGCAKVRPSLPVAAPPQVTTKPAPKVNRFTLAAQRIAGTTNLPATVRTIDPFLALPKDTTLGGLFLAVGPPDNEQGSGFWFYTYRLQDGSTLYVGSNDNMTVREVTHIKADLSLSFIIDNRKKITDPIIGGNRKTTP